MTSKSVQPSPASKRTFYLLKQVNQAIRDFDMLADGDRVAVGLSGGKDSRALLHLLNARRRACPEKYQVIAIHVELEAVGLPSVRPELEPWFKQLGIEYSFVQMDISPQDFQPLDCNRCAWNRRKALFLQASRMECNKLALGHHADDAAETTLLNLCYSGRLETLAPTRTFFGGEITIIRPLIYIEERRIAQLARVMEWPEEEKVCPRGLDSRRAWVRRWLADSGRDYRQIRTNLWRAANGDGQES
jgi:tRNA 2-thiocytidine biosynthesis protein TtcA